MDAIKKILRRGEIEEKEACVVTLDSAYGGRNP